MRSIRDGYVRDGVEGFYAGAGATYRNPHEGGVRAVVEGVPAGGRATARTLDSTIDVRCQRVDEAVAMVERFLDESLMASRDTAFIVHGHGTGAIKQALRAYLGNSAYVRMYRPGETHEGGDGVTVVSLRS